MRTLVFGAWIFSVSVLANCAFAIDATPIVTSSGGFSSIDTQPVINSNGDVAFTAIGSSGQDGVYYYSAKDTLVYRQDFGQVQTTKHQLTINAGGTIGMVGDTAAGEAIYTTTASATGGGPLITIHGDNFSQYSSPSILDDGSMYFTAYDAGSKDAGYFRASSSGEIITIFGASSLSFVPTGDLAANNSGSFAVAGADPNDGSLGIYAGSAGGSLITIMGSNFSSVSPLSVSHSGSKLAWGGTLSVSGSSSSSLYIANLDGGSVLTIAGQNFGDCSINSNGDCIFEMTDPTSGQMGLYGVTETNHSPLNRPAYLTIGDSLDGSTITDFSIGPDSLNDNGEFAFYAQLADGSSGIFSSFVPEPIFIAPLIGGILLLRRRRIGC